ncbi:4'-phosphopantetheinyl transferase family protein [Pseudoduganella violacea]|uniref:4'-phosphopantetheinyl transferase n=1 Tax=Pseudoduganella violacea TaxID=1715466 RepID=A0A7W5FVM4_9BURK|nr:4'-phosphopantetheinyl transferase superfamily protein [Pseudoduganella violacea]MBB3120967.1 4'-phosphopantetheinyl transferase [Pseudoduganella violacea]
MQALFNPLIPQHSWPPGVDLWCSGWQVLGDSVRQACAAALSAEERERMKAFLLPGAADQFLLARALLRTALSHYTGLPAADWRFRAGEHGKPYLCGPAHGGPALHFNLSHCNGMVACAVTTISAGLGVDVEHTGRTLDFTAVASMVFSPEEMAQLQALPAAERRGYFFSIWTLKEAYAKARGLGFHLPLDALSFDRAPASLGVRFSERWPDRAEGWSFSQHRLSASHLLSVAIDRHREETIPLRFQWRSPQSLPAAAGLTGEG